MNKITVRFVHIIPETGDTNIPHTSHLTPHISHLISDTSHLHSVFTSTKLSGRTNYSKLYIFSLYLIFDDVCWQYYLDIYRFSIVTYSDSDGSWMDSSFVHRIQGGSLGHQSLPLAELWISYQYFIIITCWNFQFVSVFMVHLAAIKFRMSFVFNGFTGHFILRLVL